jgi:hypothetical protein
LIALFGAGAILHGMDHSLRNLSAMLRARGQELHRTAMAALARRKKSQWHEDEARERATVIVERAKTAQDRHQDAR